MSSIATVRTPASSYSICQCTAKLAAAKTINCGEPCGCGTLWGMWGAEKRVHGPIGFKSVKMVAPGASREYLLGCEGSCCISAVSVAISAGREARLPEPSSHTADLCHVHYTADVLWLTRSA